jgi:outer membrane protein OmpA-like peptidoglycan-associated protein
LALVLGACASGGGLGRQDVIRQYPTIERLDRAVTSARSEDAAVLAPESFELAEQSLDKAVERARDAEKAEAEKAARRGLDAMRLVNENLEKSRKVFSEALDTRSRALAAGADSLFPERLREVERVLMARAQDVEEGDVATAREGVSALVRTYGELELDALKQGKLKGARAAVKDAKDAGAKKHAPRTLAEAEQELELLAAIMEADRTQTEKADAHADRTIWLANRATEITNLAKDFEDRDLDEEGIILWYQRQLLEIREPLEADLPFDRPNAEVVRVLRQDLEGLLDSLRQARMSQTKAQVRIAALQDEIEAQRIRHEKRLQKALDEVQRGNRAQVAQLRAKLEAQQSQAALEARRRKAAQERFDSVRELFLPDDGQVLREGDNVILRLYGFDFAPGKSTLETTNFALVNRIANALNVFPDANALIIGHTDSTGNDASNMELSLARATNVTALLEEIGGIAPARLEALGRGESEPVASNETREGRAKNRRIDVLIVNETAASPTGRTGD